MNTGYFYKKSKFIVASSILAISFIFTGCQQQKVELKMNQIQLLGSHNSYKIRIQKELRDIIHSKDSVQEMGLNYGHLPLEDQLNLGLRGLELDVFYDPEGGRYTNPIGQQLIESQNKVAQEFDTEGILKKPGLKVFHIQEIDFRSHCLLFTDGLKKLKKWSKENPMHLPIIITINAKDEKIAIPGFRDPLPFNAKALSSIDEEIRSVFEESQLITPDYVRGDSETLEKAILTKGWPSIENSRGKFLFALDEGTKKQEEYLKGHPYLKGRILFTVAAPGKAESAFLIMNDPKSNGEEISRLVKLGYFVRTRADADTREARNNDYSKWEAALKSGAQLISTDYYIKDTVINSDYKIELENGKDHRLNPLFIK